MYTKKNHHLGEYGKMLDCVAIATDLNESTVNKLTLYDTLNICAFFKGQGKDINHCSRLVNT